MGNLGVVFGLAVVILNLTWASAKPIMVSFGTNQGPIVPRSPKQTNTTRRTNLPENPAPVSEPIEDLPNPSTYKPLVPRQYRVKVYSVKPSPNLILGTPIDQKYTPTLEKYNIYKKIQSRSLGLEYRGPHVFEKQEYEDIDARNHKTFLKPSVSYVKPEVYRNKQVPQIGIIYSGGVRYYVPQIVYYTSPRPEERQQQEENSVYGQEDEKYYYKIQQ